jgi:UDP-N-acetylglucosamine/UDP-N-acetylgalactosamine diphosphorylase
MNPSLKSGFVLQQLLEKGVRMPAPETVWIDDAINPHAIAPDVTIGPGCRLRGARTSIGPGCVLGEEAPATIDDTQLGRGVEIKGGYVSGAVFLDRASAGSGAHIRPGTIIEEDASVAHTVGLKQTLLMPFVTAGSLVNLCDCLLAGGTSRKNHSEVGSSYVHFNFTPQQDKATASLIGDVPRGVMLDQPPIFLGGQGGLVGPARIGYGVIIAAGLVQRGDALHEGTLVVPPPATPAPEFRKGMYRGINRLVTNNLLYIGNLLAWHAWYRLVRRPRVPLADTYTTACVDGAMRQLEICLNERIQRLTELAAKMPHSIALGQSAGEAVFPSAIRQQQKRLVDQWPCMENQLKEIQVDTLGLAHRDEFIAKWSHIPAGE